MKDISKKILSEKLHQILLEDIDFKDSEVNKYIEKISLNLILTNLSFQQRLSFYNLILEDDYEKAALFVKKEIPNLNKKILDEVKKKFNTIL